MPGGPTSMRFWTNHHQSNNVEGCQAGREGTSGITRMTGMGDGEIRIAWIYGSRRTKPSDISIENNHEVITYRNYILETTYIDL